MTTNWEKWEREFCRRCGHIYKNCLHINTGFHADEARAERTRARYELGRRFNPDHDTTDYFSDPGEEPTPGVCNKPYPGGRPLDFTPPQAKY